MNDKTQSVIELLTSVAGGAGAGVLDVKFANKMPAGLPVGAVAGLGLAAVGLFGPKKVAPYALGMASGALAFEAGSIAAQKTLKSMLPATTPASTSGIAFGAQPSVGALPPRSMSNADLLRSISTLESMYGG